MPIPDGSWYPTSIEPRGPWHANFSAKAIAEGESFGLSDDQVNAIKTDAAVMVFIANTLGIIDNYDKSWTAFRNGITANAVGSAAFDYPDAPALGIQPPIVPTGIFQRTIEARKIVMAQPHYTKEVGEAWGIVPTKSSPISPTDVKPTIIVDSAATNSHFSIIAKNRGDADGYQVWALRKGSAKWELAATVFGGKSYDVHMSLTTPGEPEQVQVRIQLLKGNLEYGQISDTVFVTLNP